MSGHLHGLATLTLENELQVPITKETDRAPRAVWEQWREKISALPEIEPRTSNLLTQSLYHRATTTPPLDSVKHKHIIEHCQKRFRYRDNTQVTVVIRAFGIHVFAHPIFSVFWSSSISCPRPEVKTCVKPSLGLSANEMQLISVASKTFSACLTLKNENLLYIPFYASSLYAVICRKATSAYNGSQLYMTSLEITWHVLWNYLLYKQQDKNYIFVQLVGTFSGC
jgi:hypothetical protein